MADFNYFLNRQGVRGLQGVKGDQGDSPIITVQTETPNEYILKITNPDGTELISPNLRGNKININEGTYVRYNTETGELYTSTADGATGELAGVVRLATDADITDMDERAVVTPSQLSDALSQYLVSPDGSVNIVQNADTSLTELTVVGGLTDVPIASADTLGGVKIGKNLSITEDGTLSASTAGTTDYTQLENKPQINSIELTGNKTLDDLGIQPKGNYLTTLPDNAVTTDTDQTISGRKTFTKSITTASIYPTDEITFNSTLQYRYINNVDSITGGYHYQNGYLTFKGDTTLVGDDKLILDGRAGGLKLTAASSAYITCENTLIAHEIRTTTNKKYLTEEDVDNQTIQIIEGKLHANFDGINKEIGDVSSKVTSLEGQVGDISTTVDSNTTDIKNLKKTKNDNIFDIGKFTVVGSPTITDDGVASGFSNSNSISIYRTFSSTDNCVAIFKFKINYKVASTTQPIMWFYALGSTTRNMYLSINKNKAIVTALYDLGYITSASNIFTTEKEYDIKYETDFATYFKVYVDNTQIINQTISISGTKNIARINLCNSSGDNSGFYFAGSIDLKHFSITVDGEEVFNGLMSSTKPIYDKITSTNAELSNFKTETSTDFSAVNSALNEKANLSDLSKCASLADFNRLSATVTALEGQVGDVSAVLDNINGEVI